MRCKTTWRQAEKDDTVQQSSPLKTKLKTSLRASRRSLAGAVFAGAVLLIVSSAPAQNLFVTGFGNGTVTEFPFFGGVSNVVAVGLSAPYGLAFNSGGI